jgi:CheY-like chemotaxis protein
MRTYLIVDDNLSLAENLAEIISDQGAEVRIAASGAEALESVQRQRFDAMLTDMRMPVMHGAELVHRIRAIDPGLPALVMTAYAGDGDLEIARDEGLLAIFGKPPPLERILRQLQVAKRDGLVAVIEDDLALCDNLSEALRDQGFTPVTASTIAQGQRLGALQPMASLADLRVPGGPSGESVRLLAARFPKAPIISITAFPDEVPQIEIYQTLTKPFDTAELLELLSQLWRDRSDP